MLRNIAVQKFFLLGIFLLQCVLVAPLPTANLAQNDDPSTRPSEVPAGRRALYLFALGNFTEFYNLRLQSTIEMAGAVLADDSIANVDTEKMTNARRFLTKYMKQAKSAADAVLPPGKIDDDLNLVMQKAVVLAEFGDFARGQNVTGASDVNEEKQLLWLALLKHGWTETITELTRYMNDFYPKFAEDVLHYVESLSPEDKQLKINEILIKMYDYYVEHSQEATKTQLGKAAYNFIMEENEKKGPPN